MKSITILSLSLFEIAIAPAFHFFSPPPPCLLLPFLRSFPFPNVFHFLAFCLPPTFSLITALTFILPYLSTSFSASTAPVFFIFHSTFILLLLFYFHLSSLPASFVLFFPLLSLFSTNDNIFSFPPTALKGWFRLFEEWLYEVFKPLKKRYQFKCVLYLDYFHCITLLSNSLFWWRTVVL